MTASYLLADLALFAVLLRMIFVGLHEERRAEFVFLYAWLLWALLSLTSISSPALHLVVWIFAVPALMRAARQVGQSAIWLGGLSAALVVAAALAWFTFGRHGSDFAILAFNAHCGLAIFTGTLFVAASRHAEAPDRTLWRWMGAQFLIAGIGLELVAAGAAWLLPLISALLTGIWLLLALDLAPTPDALVNESNLAISSSGHRLITSMARSSDGSMNRSARRQSA